MRIYRRAEFLKLPAGTAYFKGGQWYFEGLTFKAKTIGNDWYELDPAWVDGHDTGECIERLEQMHALGASYPMQDSICRDGLFDEDALFLVLEKADLEKLKQWIETALAVSR